jgi:predicted DCC family thiol-disulfide oxidoreductase YuxK
VLFFDDECGLCNNFVRQVIRRDRNRLFRFAPIQGTTAKAVLPALPERPEEWAIILWEKGEVHMGSEAVLRALGRLGRLWTLLRLLLLVPHPVREAVYRYVARNRFRWFGRADVCDRVSHTDTHRLLLP